MQCNAMRVGVTPLLQIVRVAWRCFSRGVFPSIRFNRQIRNVIERNGHPCGLLRSKSAAPKQRVVTEFEVQLIDHAVEFFAVRLRVE